MDESTGDDSAQPPCPSRFSELRRRITLPFLVISVVFDMMIHPEHYDFRDDI